MIRFRYPLGPVVADYARAAGGLFITILPLLLLDVKRWAAAPLSVAAALFLAFCARTAIRHLTHFDIDETGVAARGPLGSVVRWDELSRLRLDYFSTRRGRGGGWMQLTLRGRGRALRVESSLEGFDTLAAQAVAAARRRGVPLSRSTQDNLAALGIDVETDAK